MSDQSTRGAAHVQPTTQVEYRDIPDYPGYRVGDDGSVWTRRHRGVKGGFDPEWRLMKQTPRKGYLFVNIRRAGRPKMIGVHRLVLAAFVGRQPDGMEGCHNDGNGMNNTLSNLRWDTHKANGEDMVRHGRTLRGSQKSAAKLNDAKVAEIKRLLAEGAHRAKLARRFGVTHAVIQKIAAGRTWAHIAGPPAAPSTFRQGPLTDRQVDEVWRLKREERLCAAAIARRLGITEEQARGILNGKFYRNRGSRLVAEILAGADAPGAAAAGETACGVALPPRGAGFTSGKSEGVVEGGHGAD